MRYYFWVKGYEKAGVVKANSEAEAKHKVLMSQGFELESIGLLDNEEFDGYDVCLLIEL